MTTTETNPNVFAREAANAAEATKALERVQPAAVAVRKPSIDFSLLKGGLVIQTFEDLQRMAQAFVQSGYFAGVRDVAQAVVKIQYGAELGVPPMASMQMIYFIDGRLSLAATLISSRILATGTERSGIRTKYRFKVIESDDEKCTLAWTIDGEEVGRTGFTIQQAARANLTGKTNWKNYPEAMLFNRALTKGARMFAAEVFFGQPVYTAEEHGAETLDGEHRETGRQPDVQLPKGGMATLAAAAAADEAANPSTASTPADVAGTNIPDEKPAPARSRKSSRSANETGVGAPATTQGSPTSSPKTDGPSTSSAASSASSSALPASVSASPAPAAPPPSSPPMGGTGAVTPSPSSESPPASSSSANQNGSPSSTPAASSSTSATSSSPSVDAEPVDDEEAAAIFGGAAAEPVVDAQTTRPAIADALIGFPDGNDVKAMTAYAAGALQKLDDAGRTMLKVYGRARFNVAKAHNETVGMNADEVKLLEQAKAMITKWK